MNVHGRCSAAEQLRLLQLAIVLEIATHLTIDGREIFFAADLDQPIAGPQPDEVRSPGRKSSGASLFCSSSTFDTGSRSPSTSRMLAATAMRSPNSR